MLFVSDLFYVLTLLQEKNFELAFTFLDSKNTSGEHRYEFECTSLAGLLLFIKQWKR